MFSYIDEQTEGDKEMILFFSGMIVGAFFGVFLISLLIACKKGEDEC
jgi:hypothetical protein